LQEEVEQLRRLLQEKEEELQQLHMDRRHGVTATGAEDQLLDGEENPPLSMWKKVKYVAVSICSDLFLNMVYYLVFNTLLTELSFN
jgi:hypothetical protein